MENDHLKKVRDRIFDAYLFDDRLQRLDKFILDPTLENFSPDFIIDPRNDDWKPVDFVFNKEDGTYSLPKGYDIRAAIRVSDIRTNNMLYKYYRYALLLVVPLFLKELLLVRNSVFRSKNKFNKYHMRKVDAFEQRWKIKFNLSPSIDSKSDIPIGWLDTYFPELPLFATPQNIRELEIEISRYPNKANRYLIIDTRYHQDAVKKVFNFLYPQHKQGKTPYSFNIYSNRFKQDLQIAKCPPRDAMSCKLFLKNTNEPLYEAYKTTIDGRKNRYRKSKNYEFIPLDDDENMIVNEFINLPLPFNFDSNSYEFRWLKELENIKARENISKEALFKKKSCSSRNRGKSRDRIICNAWECEFRHLIQRVKTIDSLVSPQES